MFLTIYHFIVQRSYIVANVIFILWELKFRNEPVYFSSQLVSQVCYRSYRRARATNDRLYDLQRSSLRGTIVGLTAPTTITQSDLLTPAESHLVPISWRGTRLDHSRLFCCAKFMIFHVFGLCCSHNMSIS